jgi:opacity protein-like surface antigen
MLYPIFKIIIIVLMLMTNACSMKAGIYTFDKEQAGGIFGKEQPLVLELEVMVPLKTEKMDLAVGADIVLGKTEGGFSTADGETSEYEENITNLRATYRYYLPWRSWLTPYVGAGVNYFEYSATHRSKGDEVGVCSSLDNNHNVYECYEIKEEQTNVMSGFNSNIVIGANIPIKNSNFSVVLEGRRDFSKKDEEIDFSGYQLMIGMGWRLK